MRNRQTQEDLKDRPQNDRELFGVGDFRQEGRFEATFSSQPGPGGLQIGEHAGGMTCVASPLPLTTVPILPFPNNI